MISALIDWDGDGNFTTYGDDVTSLVLGGRQAVAVGYGRDQATALSPIAAGQGGFVLNNDDRRFSPRNTTSPLYGKVRPARPVKITRDAYTLFTGLTDDSPINPDVGSRSVSISLVDALAGFAGTDITARLHQAVRTGDAINIVLDELGWTGGRDIDSGATVIPWFWVDRRSAQSVLDEIVRSEGPPALLTVGEDGSIVFRDRHHRLTRAASLTSQGTWRDKGVEPMMTTPFTYEESWQNVINAGSASVDVRRPAGEVQVVWSSDATITLSAGEQRIITASASDPFLNAFTPAAGVDYTTAAGSVTVSLLATSGVSAGIVLTAVGGAAIVNNLQLRAVPVPVAYTVQVSAEDSASIDELGRRSFSTDLPWCGPEDAQAILRTVVAQRAWPIAVVSARFMIGRDATKAAALLSRDLSDRVRVIETETYLDAEFYIESIQHEFSGEHDHTVTFGLEAVPVTVSPVLRFDTSGQGFNDGKFGDGIDDPNNLFRFDSTSGHRFNEGVFAA